MKELALSPYIDPYTDWGDIHHKKAKWAASWFAKMNRPIHLRGFHYWLVSSPGGAQARKVDGTPYEDTDADWNRLQEACRYARYLGIGDWSRLLDKKHPDPMDYAERGKWSGEPNNNGKVDVQGTITRVLEGIVDDILERILRETPQYNPDGFQNYTLVVYCEKSSMGDYIAPVVRKYKAIYQPLVGEASIERVEDIIDRVVALGKPARIFYISDFDPSGKQMPVSVARKAEFYAREVYGADVKLIPLMLTYDQVITYRLPGIPTKPTDSQAAGFVAKYGDRATELDALEALHPGQLAKILERALVKYHDDESPTKVRDENRRIKDRAKALVETLRARLEEELGNLVTNGDFGVLDLTKVLDRTWEMPKPTHFIDDDHEDWLLDTDRDYQEQLDAYHRYKGGQ